MARDADSLAQVTFAGRLPGCPAQAASIGQHGDVDERGEAGHRLVGAARLQLGAAGNALASERVSIAIPLAETGDAAVVAAMTRAVTDLAAHIAPALTSSRRAR